MSHKRDSQRIVDYMSELANALSADKLRSWWPKYVFRLDHVENAARILNSGHVLSRKQASLDSVIIHDSAAQSYVRKLAPELQDYVRLYFRPLTPTQFRNEGIRPKHEFKYGAHMPVPVFLLFSNKILTLEGVQFSKGRLVSEDSIGNSFEFFKGLKFANVYHNSSVGPLGSEPSKRSEILNARNSEVLIKHKLDLAYLKHIVCRSVPEQETLINLLEPSSFDTWKDSIRVAPNHVTLFNKLGTFVEDSELKSTRSRLKFYDNIRATSWRGPFNLDINWHREGQNILKHNQDSYFVKSKWLGFKLREELNDYSIKVRLNGDLAYLGKFHAREHFDDPF